MILDLLRTLSTRREFLGYCTTSCLSVYIYFTSSVLLLLAVVYSTQKNVLVQCCFHFSPMAPSSLHADRRYSRVGRRSYLARFNHPDASVLVQHWFGRGQRSWVYCSGLLPEGVVLLFAPATCHYLYRVAANAAAVVPSIRYVRILFSLQSDYQARWMLMNYVRGLAGHTWVESIAEVEPSWMDLDKDIGYIAQVLAVGVFFPFATDVIVGICVLTIEHAVL